MLSKKIGIDLGTSRMMVYVKGEGVVVNEPAVMATDQQGERVLAVGRAAAELLGRGGTARELRPVGQGNVVDYEVAGTMLQYLIGRIVGRQRIFRPDIMLSVAPTVTGAQRRVVLEATMQAGAKTAYLIDKPLAAAIGARLPVSTTDGLLIGNFGAGSTEIAAIASGEVLAMESIAGGSQALDEAIEASVQGLHGIRLKRGEAERLKLQIGSATPDRAGATMEVEGLDAAGRPSPLTIGSAEVCAAIADRLAQVSACLARVLAEVPTGRQAAVRRNGLVLTGGGARLHGLAELLGSRAGLPTRVASEPETCIALGTGMALDNLAVVRRGQHYIT
ncbi:MAG: rod shape-determining protein [Candidatus Dormibacteraeota bacterium]|nr:rod shape-determining protein [Candidatus Dormibacteraeota bacterium]